MVLVRPKTHETWQELLEEEPTTTSEDLTTEDSTQVESSSATDSGDSVTDEVNGGRKGVVCEVGLDLESCHIGEECVAVAKKSRNGICRCKEGWVRKKGGSGQQCEEVEGEDGNAAKIMRAVTEVTYFCFFLQVSPLLPQLPQSRRRSPSRSCPRT